MVRLDVEGQQEARAQVERRLTEGRLPHALMLEGPPGTGKHAFARRLVQIHLCGSRLSPVEACGGCPSCKKIEAETHADIGHVEPDGRFIKVGAIREMEHGLRLRPLEGPHKAVIVKDADRMTIEAQNALLKTLEEPPGSALLILVSARPRALLPTVLSRCQRVPFVPVSAVTIAQVLEREGAPGSARVAAALAQGSLARAREMDLDDLGAQRDAVAELDARLSAPGSAAGALDEARELSTDRDELRAALDLWILWARDLLLVDLDRRADVTNVDRLEQLECQVKARSTYELHRRARDLHEARLQLDLPLNLNLTLLCEQLCLAMSGMGRMMRERVR